MGFGASIPLRLAMLGDYFGRNNYATIIGLTSAITAVSGAAGPILAGLAFDLTGSYRLPFFLLSISVLIAIPLIISLQNIDTVKKHLTN